MKTYSFGRGGCWGRWEISPNVHRIAFAGWGSPEGETRQWFPPPKEARRIVSPPFWYPPILTYHRVLPEVRRDTPALHPDSFALQMQILAERFHPIPLAALADYLEGKGTLPARPVVVTFDDGTEDLFTHAFPILSKFQIPATIFQIAGQIGRPGYLSPDQILRMARGGVSFGSHGMNHEYLPSLAPGSLEWTLSESKKVIERLGIPAEFISYPGGGYTREVLGAARAAGYRGGCTTNRGERRFPPDHWALRRVTMHHSASSIWGMRLCGSGYHGLNRRLRSPHDPVIQGPLTAAPKGIEWPGA